MKRGPQGQSEAKARQSRMCLRCDRLFPSTGPHHRICLTCEHRLNGEPTPEVVYSPRWPIRVGISLQTEWRADPGGGVFAPMVGLVYPRIVYTDLISLMCKTPLMVGVPGVAAQRITSSAWNSSVGGIVRPRSFAVLRLMTSSNVVGCSTGRSAGLAPLRILST
jgi:hypothetical protein